MRKPSALSKIYRGFFYPQNRKRGALLYTHRMGALFKTQQYAKKSFTKPQKNFRKFKTMLVSTNLIAKINQFALYRVCAKIKHL